MCCIAAMLWQQLTFLASNLARQFRIQEDPSHPIPKQAYGWRLYLVTLVASLGPAMAGYDFSFIGGAIALDSFNAAFDVDVRNKAMLAANITSIVFGGAFVGTMGAYWLAEKYGRKVALLSAAVVAVVGSVMQLFPSKGLLFGGRAILGLGIGAEAANTAVYLAELAPTTIRGRIVGIKDMIMMTAALCGYWINYGVKTNLAPTATQWRIPFGLQLVIPGIMLMTVPFIVESPRWLAEKGRRQDALRSLSWIRNLPEDHEHVQWELREIYAQCDANAREGVAVKRTIKELFSHSMRGRLFRSAGTKIMNPLTGIQAIALFSPQIFKALGFEKQELLLTGFYGVTKVVFSFIILLLAVDNLGRRKIVLSGSVVIVICHLYLGAYSQISGSFSHKVVKDGGAYMALVACYFFSASYAWSWAIFPCVFSAEIFPTHLRALAMAITNMAAFLMLFAFSRAIPYMLEDIQYGLFYFFAATTTVSAALIWLFYPETKAFPLENMDMLFTSVWAKKARREGERALQEKRALSSSSSGSSNVELEERREPGHVC